MHVFFLSFLWQYFLFSNEIIRWMEMNKFVSTKWSRCFMLSLFLSAPAEKVWGFKGWADKVPSGTQKLCCLVGTKWGGAPFPWGRRNGCTRLKRQAGWPQKGSQNTNFDNMIFFLLLLKIPATSHYLIIYFWTFSIWQTDAFLLKKKALYCRVRHIDSLCQFSFVSMLSCVHSLVRR